MNNTEIKDRAAKIKMIALDNDGVLTDGKVWVDSDGQESKAYNMQDGFGVILGRQAGIIFAIITGIKTRIVESRAERLRIEEVHEGLTEKAEILEGIAKKYNLILDQIAYMGDDLIDLRAMKIAGLGTCPANAQPDVKNGADWISTHDGGKGAVRELVELILKARGDWDQILESYISGEAELSIIQKNKYD
ncbi:MAG: HAD hydrolase family protein [Calditrichaeota bacterium]|jgi:3-deoxy-D-manno-octulosonate 8-phosphate phosphatase (KDO 8-P phosphatase)|nr:HAD hydrolase family protein [Calditrichota bacterium]